MTLHRVAFSKAASGQASAIDDWWREHRPSAPDMFWRELEAVVELLRRSPLIGPVYAASPVPGVRRMLIGRSRHHVYWEVDPASRAVTITAVWHAGRGSEPPLRAV
jgi:plasmid stabilization system protein ParE